MKKLDLTNQRFGRLTVIKEDPVPYRAPSGKSCVWVKGSVIDFDKSGFEEAI